MSFLDYPLQWTTPALRELHGALTTSFYRVRDIDEIITAAGVPPGNVSLEDPPRTIWREAMKEAAGHGVLRDVVAQAGERLPAFATRAAELLAAEPVVAAPLPADRPEVLSAADPRWKGFTAGGNERQIVEGDETLLDVAFLERGVGQARAVCLLTVRMASGLYYGTGFRIGPSLLLTNHHVLHDWDHDDARAMSVSATFGYEMDVDGQPGQSVVVSADVESIAGQREHDFAVIPTTDPIPDAAPILSLGTQRPVEVDDRVLIVQHPNGLPKKVALAHNLVRHVDADVVQYWTDTEPGSSGSPVFNEHWEVVALHHCWVESPTGDGTAFRNQGRAIGRVAQQLQALGVNGWDR